MTRLLVVLAALVALAIPAVAFSHSSDPDHDRMSNRAERLSGTNPRVADTDNDCVTDDDEDADHDGVDNANEIDEGTK
ncbi:MAG: hypothetical protein H0U24_01295, partial [Thermoleophilaceae bacterium]|nr:hypothetical protein [Thermoleophilaceae bacterium]